MAEAHLIKVSAEDLVYLGFEGIDPEAAARTLFAAPGVKLIALTLGERGGILLSKTGSVRLGIPNGVQAAVIDTVGAGDCFLAGLVASLQRAGALSRATLSSLDNATLEQALQCAIASASLNVMREGCNPPTTLEVAQFLAQSPAV